MELAINSSFLSAISTPLASIFGSGFLVIVPILAGAVGSFSTLAMLVICLLAIWAGHVIRFNIAHAEPVIQTNSGSHTAKIDKLSDISLIVAYVISVCLYLHILSAFVLNSVNLDTQTC